MTVTSKRSVTDKIHLACLLARRKFFAISEWCSYLLVRPQQGSSFVVVSCERNAGPAAIKCLESVYLQTFDRSRVRHVFVDDASTDDTHELISAWLEKHPDHNVEYIHNQERMGGTANTLFGFRKAPESSIVVELNGDDWLADNKVLRFLDKVYSSHDVWMTYNTLRYLNSLPALWARPLPADIVRENRARDFAEWVTSAPHTFRKKLFDHIAEDTFLDPETGRYWESADDQAIYLAMLELAGEHARHLYRISYIYNVHDASHVAFEAGQSQQRAKRVRQSRKYEPLESL